MDHVRLFFTPAQSCNTTTADGDWKPAWRTEMDASVSAVEGILSYSFKDKLLIEDALTHSSCTDSPSYEQLEFVGDAALGLAVTKHLYLEYPVLDPGQLTLLRAANVSREKLARVAIRHGLYRFLRRNNTTALDDQVREFADVVSQEQEDDAVAHGGSMKAPKILSDIVESVAAAIYVDADFDLQRLWMVIKGLLEPIVTLENLHKQPQPVTLLYELCQKQGKQLDIKPLTNETESSVRVYVDGEFFASSTSKALENARLNAAREALSKLSSSMPAQIDLLQSFDGKCDIEGEAKQRLREICCKKKWSQPCYKKEKDEGPAHLKKYVCSVKISNRRGVYHKEGDEKTRIKDAENSAASLMLRALQELPNL